MVVFLSLFCFFTRFILWQAPDCGVNYRLFDLSPDPSEIVSIQTDCPPATRSADLSPDDDKTRGPRAGGREARRVSESRRRASLRLGDVRWGSSRQSIDGPRPGITETISIYSRSRGDIGGSSESYTRFCVYKVIKEQDRLGRVCVHCNDGRDCVYTILSTIYRFKLRKRVEIVVIRSFKQFVKIYTCNIHVIYSTYLYIHM